ncbi:MAG: UDP-N-acetylmuramoyl-L-alanyl-D-glutamate--2,6-diaminopimelate ligase [Candidatus Omnitrophica bacterium]|nr:UDP-N-acetylmuramoyl-L-alanyl-D-glutamate--2,6-diaminopimelate ligase [Candidatus Omnitrophota bacterium]MBD3269455.1 UDP-N-acetylmuramoyl-L-alanyl-D-glutamate--2,6-diaminopimelate ligase [Candidatus Omnitrophota bacterium]
MRLKEIYPYLSDEKLKDITFRGVSCDSRYVQKGDIFFIIGKGKFDIFSVLGQIEPKINIFVGALKDREKITSAISKKPVIFVEDPQKDFLKAVDMIYGLGDKKIEFIGVTGTNGKTTTSSLIYHILKETGYETSLIGTVYSIVGRKRVNTGYTTPDFLLLRRLLSSLEAKKKSYAVLEVSSHGISQGRVRGIPFSCCIFTNLSRDHLDYHKTMDRYFKVKKNFFLDNRQALSIINIDDSYGRKIGRELKKKVFYGLDRKAHFCATEVEMSKKYLRFRVHGGSRTLKVESSLCGRHNVYNILAALSTVACLGVSLDVAVRGIRSFKGVEGRLEEAGDDIFIDYAHTPAALGESISALKDIGYKKVITVFGCGGDRDKGKRRTMGRVSSRQSYFTYVTSDNPRSEEPRVICRQIEQGFEGDNYALVLDREKAIKEAIRLLSREKKKKSSAGGVCVLIAGKGHEDYQLIEDKKIPFKDSAIVKNIVK